jgi:DNA-binding response OmpR family regulator
MVEDDTVIADMLKELLAGAGYRVQWAPDVISALYALERESVDLITLDMELGTYGGHGFLALLKAEPHTSSIPVVVISSSQVSAEVRGLADHVLSKPFSIEPLLQVIASSVRRCPASLDVWQDALSDDNLELEVAREVLD